MNREIKFRAWNSKDNKYYHEVGFHRSMMQWVDGYKRTDSGALIVSPMFNNYISPAFTTKTGKKFMRVILLNLGHLESIIMLYSMKMEYLGVLKKIELLVS